MNIHLISTGAVKITQNWVRGDERGLGRMANTLLDRRFTDWLPIYCAVIEHPEGLVVIDAGILSNANDPIYFPPHMRLLQRAASFQITPQDELGAQMRARSLNPSDVRWVILTHLHQDHDGGLHFFPNAEFVVSRREWAAAQGFAGRLGGYQNQRWPKNLAPTQIDFSSGAYHSFAFSQVITRAGDLRLVPTPGHCAGHLSVVLEQGDRALFFAGDAAYTEQLLLEDVVDGVGPDPAIQRDTHRRIRALASQIPLVFLPSHDPDAQARLAKRAILPVEYAAT